MTHDVAAGDAATGMSRLDEGDTRSAEERALLVLEQAPLGMAVVDMAGRFLSVNRALCNLSGWTEDELLSMSFQDITHPDDLGRDLEMASALLSGRREGYAVDERYQRSDGTYIWVHVAVSLGRDEEGQAVCYIFHIQDIEARRQGEEELARLVLTDPLTGLANRRLLIDRLEHAQRRRARTGGEIAVIVVDLDDLKTTNRELGHGIGDRVLCEVARRLGDTVRQDDTISRWGGDEFVLCCSLNDAVYYSSLLARVHRVCSAPLVLGGEIIPVSASVGGVLASSEETAVQVLDRADLAMHRDKAEKRVTTLEGASST